MPSRPLLLGHRGARSEKSVPENTFDSFDLALAYGCDGIEFDVRLSADKRAVICHNPKIHALEISQSSGKELGLPLLEEVLDRYRRKAFLDVELKVPGLELVAAKLLKKFLPDRGYVISSFLPQVLQAIRSLDQGIPLGFICDTRAAFQKWRHLPIEYVIPQSQLLSKSGVSELKAAGKKILVWTVNASADMKRFGSWGVDGIISDYPKRLSRMFNDQAGKL